MRAMQINVRESTRNLSLTIKNAFASFILRIEIETLLMELQKTQGTTPSDGVSKLTPKRVNSDTILTPCYGVVPNGTP
jgi:hypothetical protein